MLDSAANPSLPLPMALGSVWQRYVQLGYASPLNNKNGPIHRFLIIDEEEREKTEDSFDGLKDSNKLLKNIEVCLLGILTKVLKYGSIFVGKEKRCFGLN